LLRDAYAEGECLIEIEIEIVATRRAAALI
jgi:hypothetical protein